MKEEGGGGEGEDSREFFGDSLAAAMLRSWRQRREMTLGNSRAPFFFTEKDTFVSRNNTTGRLSENCAFPLAVKKKKKKKPRPSRLKSDFSVKIFFLFKKKKDARESSVSSHDYLNKMAASWEGREPRWNSVTTRAFLTRAAQPERRNDEKSTSFLRPKQTCTSSELSKRLHKRESFSLQRKILLPRCVYFSSNSSIISKLRTRSLRVVFLTAGKCCTRAFSGATGCKKKKKELA